MRSTALLLLAVLLAGCTGEGRGPALRVFCGAGLQPAMEELSAEFRKRSGARIDSDFAGSNFLLGSIKVSSQGDIFLPGDTYYIDLAEKEGLILEKAPVCFFVPVIFVPPGNPGRIAGAKDLARPGLRIGLGDPRVCAVGLASDRILEKNGIPKEEAEKNVVFRALTVNSLALHVAAGKIDGAIVWDAVARQFAGKGEIIPIPDDQNSVSELEAGILRSTREPDLSRRFLSFLGSPAAKEIFRRHGYTTEYRGKP